MNHRCLWTRISSPLRACAWLEHQRRSLASISSDSCRPSSTPSVSPYLAPTTSHVHIRGDSRHVTRHSIKGHQLIHLRLNWQVIALRTPSSATAWNQLWSWPHSCFKVPGPPVTPPSRRPTVSTIWHILFGETFTPEPAVSLAIAIWILLSLCV